MNFYKDNEGRLHALDDSSFKYLLPDGCTEITKNEYDALVVESQSETDSQKLVNFKTQVQAALDASDLVALRTYKAGVAFGAVWTAYDASLRKLMSITSWSDDLKLTPKPDAYPS